MKRFFPFNILLSFFLMMIMVPSLRAQELQLVEWGWKYLDNGSVEETVSVKDTLWQGSYNGWTRQEEADGLVFYRSFPSLEAYMNCEDRLPIQVERKDYFIWQRILITSSDQQLSGNMFSSQLHQEYPIWLSLYVAGGFLKNEKGAVEAETLTIPMREQMPPDFELSAIIFDGLTLGVTFFGLGALLVLMILFRNIQKTNRFIKEEYDLRKPKQKYPKKQMIKTK